jgi:hypothetical protein
MWRSKTGAAVAGWLKDRQLIINTAEAQTQLQPKR